LTDDYNELLFFGDNRKRQNLIQDFSSLSVNKIPATISLDNPSKIYKIPIFFHIVYNRQEENIGNDQIYNQIESLNNDFRNKNLHLIPTKFTRERDLATDARIEFSITSQDSDGRISERITRKQTTVKFFEFFNESGSVPLERQPVKSSDLDGEDAVEPEKYLNVWICRLNRGKGYAQYPRENPTTEQWLTDGIVVDYRAVGSGGTATKPTDAGRTLTHEIGHWLGLYHVYGSGTRRDCDSSDEVCDTPPQSRAQSGCPSNHSAKHRCGREDLPLLMNFMDDFDDKCSLMFTKGQVKRMHRCLNSLRRHIIN
jgi:hypothetical protein